MNAYIARDGAEIGDFPRGEIERRAREGELLPTDYYWHEGMENWLLLEEVLATGLWREPEEEPVAPITEEDEEPDFIPLSAAPIETAPLKPILPERFRLPVIIGGTALLLLLLVIGVIKSRSDNAREHALFPPAAPAPEANAASDRAIRDKASADLRQRLERLPSQAKPPLFTFYYDVSVNMRKNFSQRVPWTAIIRGGENVVNPETQATITRTSFVLTADYQDGVWAFKHYKASASNMVDSSTANIEHDENTPAPPSIVGVLGLKQKGT